MAARAPVVDPNLAALFASEPNPFEAISADQTAAMPWKVGFNAELIMKHGRLAALDCGHFVLTKALRNSRCQRCGEMIRAGYDYDAFRNRGEPDAFSWPGDPLHDLHEAGRGETTEFSPI